MNSFAGIFLVLAAARVGLWIASVLHRRWAIQAETTRKLLHTFVGLELCATPWLFDSAWPLAALAAIFLALLIARPHVRLLNPPAVQLMFAVGRRTYGEFLFPVAAALLFPLARGRPLLFCIPMLILALADTAAALVGSHYGRRQDPVRMPAKSLEGSAAFALTAFLAAHITLLLATDLPRVATLLVAVNLAIALAAVEALCTGGWDNLLVPLVGFFLLRAMLAISPGALAACVGLNVVALLLVWQRRPIELPLQRRSHASTENPA